MPDFLAQLSPGITVGTVCGRYYSMDRDNRWERVSTAYDVMVLAKGVAPTVKDPLAALAQGYADGLTDEFINPTVVGGTARQFHPAMRCVVGEFALELICQYDLHIRLWWHERW